MKKNKSFSIILVIIILFFLIVIYAKNYTFETFINGKTNYISIKDLQQNSLNYVGKNVTIKGNLNSRFGGYSLQDDDGYWIWIGEDELGKGCVEGQREYSKSRTYTATGIFLAPIEGSSIFDFEHEYRLKCNKPIE